MLPDGPLSSESAWREEAAFLAACAGGAFTEQGVHPAWKAGAVLHKGRSAKGWAGLSEAQGHVQWGGASPRPEGTEEEEGPRTQERQAAEGLPAGIVPGPNSPQRARGKRPGGKSQPGPLLHPLAPRPVTGLPRADGRGLVDVCVRGPGGRAAEPGEVEAGGAQRSTNSRRKPRQAGGLCRSRGGSMTAFSCTLHSGLGTAGRKDGCGVKPAGHRTGTKCPGVRRRQRSRKVARRASQPHAAGAPPAPPLHRPCSQ